MAPLLTVLALVAVATMLGVVWQHQQGRVRHPKPIHIDIPTVGLPSHAELGKRATLLQFSTDVCSPCKATHTVLDAIARDTADVSHVDLDVTHRPDLANEYGIMQTPTTLILDATGTVRARIGGAVRRDLVTAELARIALDAPATEKQAA
jgi:thiol-disulfide isomerase/thioredoxin